MFEEIMNFKDKLAIDQQNLPKHIALVMNGSFGYAKAKGLPSSQVSMEDFEKVKDLINAGVRLKIPVLSFYVMSEKMKDSPSFPARIESLRDFFKDLMEWKFIQEKGVRISVLGKWYDLPANIVDDIKKIISATREYDSYFVNLCINYDGRSEIVDACRMIARQVKSDKLEIEAIDHDSIKENLYSSYFPPPDLLVKTGLKPKTNGFLLWDSAYSKIHFTGKRWPEFEKNDLYKAILRYQGKI